MIFPSILYTIPLLNHKYNILVPQFNGLRWIFSVEGIDKQRCRPRCLSSKAIIGDLSMTPDRRKTLVFSRKSQETCLKAVLRCMGGDISVVVSSASRLPRTSMCLVKVGSRPVQIATPAFQPTPGLPRAHRQSSGVLSTILRKSLDT